MGVRWSSYANREGFTETVINNANEYYNFKGIALINKRPTPIKPLKTKQVKRKHKKGYTYEITKAVFEKKSTVDFDGIYKGYSIAFDMKKTIIDTRFPLSNIEDEQYMYLYKHYKHGGISFLIIYFEVYDEWYLLPFETLQYYYENKFNGGRKSIPYKVFKEDLSEFLMANKTGAMIDYLPMVDKYINMKSNNLVNF